MLSTRIPPTLLDNHNNINMELKTTEEEVEKMVMEYKLLLKTESRLVDLELKAANDNNRNDAPFLLADTLENETIIMNEAQVLSTLESLQVRITALEPRMNRFRKRLGEVRNRVFCYHMYVLRVVLKQNNETDGALPQNRKIQ